MQKVGTNRKSALKKALPYGSIKEIAKRSNTSIYTVSRVIKGGSKNPDVIKALTAYLQELAQTNQQLDQVIELNLL